MELVLPDVRGKEATRVLSLTERLAVEAAEDLIASGASESTTQQEEFVIDLLQPTIEYKKETRVQSVCRLRCVKPKFHYADFATFTETSRGESRGRKS